MIDKLEDRLIGGGAAIIGFIAGLYGGWTQGTKVLVLLMVIDFALGCLCALTGHSQKTVTGHFLSQVAFAGILKKATIMLVILVAVQLDKAVGTGGGSVMFRTAAEFFYIATEGLSIVENAGLLGVPIPKFLRRMLEALRDKSDSGEKLEEKGEGEKKEKDEEDEEAHPTEDDKPALPPEMIDDGK